jgi:hypothetical protein
MENYALGTEFCLSSRMAWLETVQTDRRARLVRHWGALHPGFAGADRSPHLAASVVSVLFFFPARN